MQIGYATTFRNPDGARPGKDVRDEEVRFRGMPASVGEACTRGFANEAMATIQAWAPDPPARRVPVGPAARSRCSQARA